MTDQRNIRIAFLGGGSMNFGWQFISELAGEELLGGTVLLYDTDKQLALTNEVIGNKLREHPTNKSNFIYLTVDKIEEALRNADFVIISITQGTIEEMVSDIHLPEMYGIYQSSGESSGPSGIMRSIRTLPQYIEFAEKIKEICPDAWVINLSSPMAVCMDVLYKTFPKIKAVGCSNEPLYSQELIAEFVSQETDGKSISRREIKTNLVGINGFSWFTEAAYQGEDVMGIFKKNTERYSLSGYEKHPGEYKANPFASANMVKFDMFLRYGAIAAAADRNIADFCPPWYVKTPKIACAWKLGMISVNYLKKRRNERLLRSKKLMTGEEYLKVGSSKNDCVNIIKALIGISNIITNGDLPNNGQVSNLPVGAVVQTNCLFSQNSVKPVMSGELPDELCSLTLRHVYNQKTLVKSVLEKDLDIAFNAFLNDPLVTSDLASSTELFKEMLAGIRAHLVYYC